MEVLGVDGAAKGWVGVRWDGTAATPLFHPTLAGLCELAGSPDVVAVDMPIEVGVDGPRACDVAARPLLGVRRSSLFAPPVRAALDFATYAEANAWSKQTVGAGISKQAWMLVPKILEVRAFEAATELAVYETFPELSFRAMNDGRPLSHPKRTWTGLATRLALLADHGVDLPVEAGAAGSVAADDLIDAGALAWSAMRIAEDRAEHLPAVFVPGEPSIWW